MLPCSKEEQYTKLERRVKEQDAHYNTSMQQAQHNIKLLQTEQDHVSKQNISLKYLHVVILIRRAKESQN